MKRNIFFLVIISILSWSCQNNEIIEDPLLTIKVDTINAITIDTNNIPVFKKGSIVKFSIDAKADIITFYSGEPGMMYKNKDRTIMEGAPYLTFDLQLEGVGMPSGYFDVI